jgi:hypothetical protein
MLSVLAVGLSAAVCTGNTAPQTVTDRCVLTSATVNVFWSFFLDVNAGSVFGGAICVDSAALVTVWSDAFRNCFSGAKGSFESTSRGGCVYLKGVLSGARLDFCCAGGCGGYFGSFTMIESSVSAGIRGLGAFDGSHGLGAMRVESATTLSESNVTRGTANWHSSYRYVSGFDGCGTSQTNASFCLFSGCSGGSSGVFAVESSHPSMLFECLFIKDADGAIAHGLAAGQDVVENSFFQDTALRGGAYSSGSTLLKNCLFAGETLETLNFIAAGVQREYATTALVFDIASFLQTCGGIAGMSPAETPTWSVAATTRTPKLSRVMSPYARPRAFVRLGLFAMSFLLLA